MKNILFIQLYRYSDLVQSTPAIAAMRCAYPQAHISVLVRKSCADGLQGNPDVNEVIAWDTKPLCDNAGKPDHDIHSMELLRGFVASLRRRNFDAVYNLSSDQPSALLTYLLNAPTVAGLIFSRDRRHRIHNHWMRYLFLATELRHLNGLNVADILIEACAGGHKTMPTINSLTQDMEYAEEIIQDNFGPRARPGARPVALQVAAGKEYKHWPSRHFVELGAALARGNADLLFLGAEEDCEPVQAIIDALPGSASAVNLAGKTTFPQMAALLKHCHYLVTSDATAAQVAAAAGTPCLFLAYGPMSGPADGPYSDNSYVLEPATACYPCDIDRFCAGLPCRDMLTADAALAGIRCMLSNGEALPTALRTDNVVLNRSTWMPDGMLGLEPLNTPKLTLCVLLRTILRAYVLSCSLRVERHIPEPNWRPWVDDIFNWYRIDDPHTLTEKIILARKDLALLQEHAESGLSSAGTAARGRGKGRHVDEAIHRLLSAVRRVEQRILDSEQNEVVRFLVAGFRHALRDLEGLPLAESAPRLRTQYLYLANGCAFLRTALDEFLRELHGRRGRMPSAEYSRPGASSAYEAEFSHA